MRWLAREQKEYGRSRTSSATALGAVRNLEGAGDIDAALAGGAGGVTGQLPRQTACVVRAEAWHACIPHAAELLLAHALIQFGRTEHVRPVYLSHCQMTPVDSRAQSTCGMQSTSPIGRSSVDLIYSTPD